MDDWLCTLEGLGVIERLRDVPDPAFWREQRVFLTGHTGFKGSWLAVWLTHLGADVHGYALPPATGPSLFDALQLASRVRHTEGDVRDVACVAAAMKACQPTVVIHMAAQPIVRRSYREPVETYMTNVMGTVNLLEAVRETRTTRAVVVVTSDKCYENREWVWGYRESEPLGGSDPYSSSKACAELVAGAYRRSFFSQDDQGDSACSVSTVRAGNVIGGGDWNEDRIIPDAVRAFSAGGVLEVRNPAAVRPWQHVLDPLRGYLVLAERSVANPSLAGPWNFGPPEGDAWTVAELVESFSRAWGDGAVSRVVRRANMPHEATSLRLDCSKARSALGWRPRVPLGAAVELSAGWYRAFYGSASSAELLAHVIAQIDRYATS